MIPQTTLERSSLPLQLQATGDTPSQASTASVVANLALTTTPAAPPPKRLKVRCLLPPPELEISEEEEALLKEKSSFFRAALRTEYTFQESLKRELNLHNINTFHFYNFLNYLRCDTTPPFLQDALVNFQLCRYLGVSFFKKSIEKVLEELDDLTTDHDETLKLLESILTFGPFNIVITNKLNAILEKIYIESSNETILKRIGALCDQNKALILNITIFNLNDALIVSTKPKNIPLSLTWENEKGAGNDLKSLLQLKENLVGLNLSKWSGLTNDHLAIIAELKNLTDLNLNYCHNIGDVGIKNLEKLSNLKVLLVKFCSGVGDTALSVIGNLKSLTGLDLTGCSSITDNGIGLLKTLVNLDTLILDDCFNITDKSLEHISIFSKLITLSLARCPQITDEGLSFIARLTKLSSLYLDDCTISGDGLKYLRTLKLKLLDISKCANIKNAAMNHLKPLTSLEDLNLSECYKITEYFLNNLSEMRSLEKLSLKGLPISEKGLKYLPNLKTLSTLELGESNFSKEGLKIIEELSELKHFYAPLPFKDEAFDKFLCSLTFLQKLQTLVLEAPLRPFYYNTPLLQLDYIQITSIKSLRTLHLKKFSLGDTNFILSLRTLPNLKTVVLENCSSLESKALLKFLEFQQLRKLHLISCMGIFRHEIEPLLKKEGLKVCFEEHDSMEYL